MKLVISCLGRFQVELDGVPVKFVTDYGRALFAYLAVEHERPHLRSRLASLLWPEQPDTIARQNLRQTIFHMRQSLRALDGRDALLEISARTLKLNMLVVEETVEETVEGERVEKRVESDLYRFQQLLAACNTHSHHSLVHCPECITRLRQATELYQGEFLAGFFLKGSQVFEEWAIYLREQLHFHALTALHTLAVHYEEMGLYKQVHAYASRQLALEPWYEGAHGQVMRALVGMGDRAGALAQYLLCQRILAEEMGAKPSAELTSLYEQIVADTYPSRTPFSPGKARSRDQWSRAQWNNVPVQGNLYGREHELAQLQEWLGQAGCRMIGVVGMGGVGKTSLVATAVSATTEHFEVVIWQSLLNSLPWEGVLQDWLEQLSDRPLTLLPESVDKQLALLLGYLRQRSCLIVLDNLESVLSATPGASSASSRRTDAAYAGYELMIQYLAEQAHPSKILFTSRERPLSFLRISTGTNIGQAGGRLLTLQGLDLLAGQAMLLARQVVGSPTNLALLVERYSGNPLALKLVVETIHELFAGDVATFLETGAPVFGDIRKVLDQQFSRLSPLEKELIFWFAISRSPISIQTIFEYLLHSVGTHRLFEALRTLQQRSLIERVTVAPIAAPIIASAEHYRGSSPHADTSLTPNMLILNSFTLQNVVMEYVTDCLVEAGIQEIAQEQLLLFHQHAYVLTQTYEHVRQSQLRLFVHPIAQRLSMQFGRAELVAKLGRIVAMLHATPLIPTYAAGNLLNIYLCLNVDITGYDFSYLSVRQADLRNAILLGVNFEGAELATTLFADASGPVVSTGVSRDGTLVAGGTVDGKIRLWKSSTFQLIETFREHDGSVLALVFSPQADLLASAGEDCTLRIWDIQTHSVQILRGHTRRIFSVNFSSDGKRLASGSEDGTVRLWDVASGELCRVLQGDGWVRSVVFSPDGKLLACGGVDQTIRLWNAVSGQLLNTLQGHTAWVNALAFSPDGLMLASASSDHTVRLWDLQIPEQAHELEMLTQHTLWVWTVAFASDGSTLASGGSDTVIHLWKVDPLRTAERKPTQVLHRLHGHTDIVESITFTPDGNTLVSGGADQLFCVWDVQRGQMRHLARGSNRCVRSLAFSRNGKILATGSYDHLVHLWDIETGRIFQTLRHLGSGIGALAFSPNGEVLATGNSDGTIRLWNILDTPALDPRHHLLHGHRGDVISLAFSPDGLLLASASADNTIHLWDAQRGKLRSVLLGHTNEVRSISFTPDGQYLVSGSDDKTIFVWDIAARKMQRLLGQHDNMVWSVAVSPDGSCVASSSSDLTLRLWDLESHSQIPLAVLRGHTERAFVVRFSPDGKRLITSSADRTVRIWDIESERVVQVLKGHTHWAMSMDVSPDGSLIASGGPDETVRLWDSATGECLQTWLLPGPYVGMNITDAVGLSEAEIANLHALGAVEHA